MSTFDELLEQIGRSPAETRKVSFKLSDGEKEEERIDVSTDEHTKGGLKMTDETEKVAKPKTYKTVIEFTESGQLRVPKGYGEVREAIRGGMPADEAAEQFEKEIEVCEQIAAALASKADEEAA